MKSLVLVALPVLFLTGCLKTRNDVRDNEQRQVMNQQVATLQRNNADASTRVVEMEETIRNMHGRIEVVENRLNQSSSSHDNSLRAYAQQNQELGQRVMILQEALTKMESQLNQVTAEVNGMKAASSAQAAAAAERAAQAAKAAKRDPYEVAQEAFNKKDWKQSILNFQKYRDENPKGGKFADATYKIGVSFQELGMKDESKTFYDEVVNKFPKSDEARRAKVRLKGLKK